MAVKLTVKVGVAYKAPMTGKELRAIREKLKLTPTQAAASIEVSARTWSRWEAEKKPVPATAARLFLILHGLDKPEHR